MTGQDLIADMLALAQAMEETIDDLRQEGIKAAEYDREYRMSKAVKMPQLKAQGWAATVTEALANGDEEVALARFERDKQEALRDASKETLNMLKRRYDLYRSIWEKEFGRG
jgi:hypothetical protein